MKALLIWHYYKVLPENGSVVIENASSTFFDGTTSELQGLINEELERNKNNEKITILHQIVILQ